MNNGRVKPEHIRKEQILSATFDTIYELGLTNTTIAKIAKKAGLSTGIVSHYFGDKQGLINACMRQMLNTLRKKTEQYRSTAGASSKEKIKAIIDSNFDISQTNAQAMQLWLDFWSASMHHPDLQRLQRINDQRLYSNLKHHFSALLSVKHADIAARGMAALIDGLWLRSSLMSHEQQPFDTQMARQIAYNYLEMYLKFEENNDFLEEHDE